MTTKPCTMCYTAATGEYIVKMFGEKRGVRVALCAHHHTEFATGGLYTVKPAKPK
jgi:hypothetical protein